MVPGIPSSTCDPSSRQEAASVRPPSRTSSTTTSKYCTSRSERTQWTVVRRERNPHEPHQSLLRPRLRQRPLLHRRTTETAQDSRTRRTSRQQQQRRPRRQDAHRQSPPKVSDNQAESILLSHLQKDQRQFMNTTDAVSTGFASSRSVTSSGICPFDVADEHWDHEPGGTTAKSSQC